MQTSTLTTPLGDLSVTASGTGPAVVFLHGLMTNSTVWDETVTRLSSAVRCVRVDLPLGAHGTPALPDADLSVPSMARALAPALSEMLPDGYWLVGSDTGGVIAQQMVCNHPQDIRALLLLPCDLYDNFLPLPLRYLQLAARVPGAMWAVRWALEVPAVRNLPIAFGWLTRQSLTQDLARQSIDPLRDRGVRRDLAKVLRAVDPSITLATAKALPEVDLPIHFLWATDDKLFPVRQAKKLADSIGERARWSEVTGSYSFIQVDRPAAVVRAVQDLVG